MERSVEPEEMDLLAAMAGDAAIDAKTRKRAQAVLGYLNTGNLNGAAQQAGVSKPTLRKYLPSKMLDGKDLLPFHHLVVGTSSPATIKVSGQSV